MRMHIVLIYILGIFECDIFDVYARANCPRLPSVPGLRIKLRGRGRVARFRCRRKFKLIGSKMAVCINNKWTHPTPLCASTRCKKLVVDNTVNTAAELGGARIRFHCSPGNVLNGNDTMFCAFNRTWVGTIPTCTRQPAKAACTFELPNLCGWSQDQTDDFDWSYGTRRTPTASTGPDGDHTLGTGLNGHYMYVESSSPRKYGDIARLLSPFYDKTDGGLCFEFWFHLKGPTGNNQTGDLKVYILQEGGTLPNPSNASYPPVFAIQGNQGDNWKRGNIVIGQQVLGYQIVFVAFRRNSYVSDIAIDDVKLYNCSEHMDMTTIVDGADMTTESITERTTNTDIADITTSSKIASTFMTSKLPTKYSTNLQTQTITIAGWVTTQPDTEAATTQPLFTSSAWRLPTTVGIQNTGTTESEIQTTLSSTTKNFKTATSDSLNMTNTAENNAWESTTNMLSNISQTNIVYETVQSDISKTNSSNFTTTPKLNKPTTTIPVNNGGKFTSKPQVSLNDTENVSNTTDDDFPNLIPTRSKSRSPGSSVPLKPLMIGLGVGVAIGLIIVIVGIHLWTRNKRKKELQFADEMQPITKSGSHEW